MTKQLESATELTLTAKVAQIAIAIPTVAMALATIATLVIIMMTKKEGQSFSKERIQMCECKQLSQLTKKRP